MSLEFAQLLDGWIAQQLGTGEVDLCAAVLVRALAPEPHEAAQLADVRGARPRDGETQRESSFTSEDWEQLWEQFGLQREEQRVSAAGILLSSTIV